MCVYREPSVPREERPKLFYRGLLVAELEPATAHHPHWLSVGRLEPLEGPADAIAAVREWIRVSEAHEAEPWNEQRLDEIGHLGEVLREGWTVGLDAPGDALQWPPGLTPLGDGWWEVWWQYAEAPRRGPSH